MRRLIFGMLIACTAAASAQGLLPRRGLLGSRMRRDEDLHDKKVAAEIAEKLTEPTMQRRIKRLLDEPLPTDLAEISFSNAVMMAKSGKADGYFALALHYAKNVPHNLFPLRRSSLPGVPMVEASVDYDADTAWQLLKKSADLGCPIGTLIFAMAEESRMFPGSARDANFNIGQYVDQKNSHSYGFHPFLLETNSTGIAKSDSCYSVTNHANVAYIRHLYERATALEVSGARGELGRFDERVAAALLTSEENAKNAECRRREADGRRTNAEFANAMLGIPVESRESLWRKDEDMREEAEKRRIQNLEERVTALEKVLKKERR